MKLELNNVIKTKQGRLYIINSIDENKTYGYELLPLKDDDHPEFEQDNRRQYGEYLKNNNHLKDKMSYIDFIKIYVDAEWFNQRQCKIIG